MRHRWNPQDICVHCGTRRSGFGGGRTGRLTYYSAWGVERTTAGPCEPASLPELLKQDKPPNT